MKTFRELGLGPEFVSVLEKDKITIPSEIQEKTIPLVLAGKDVIGGSATGSGKTLVFASGIVENLKKNNKVQALILTPTRELAEQVANSIAIFSKHKNLNVLPVYGGVSIENQIKKLRNTDVVVGTPGRILDHLGRGSLNLSEIKFLVLDEVDRMFDMGFRIDVKRILEECPKKRQTMLFSATISGEIDYLAGKYTRNPVEVSIESHVDPSKLKQVYYDVPDNMKFSLFFHLLEKEKAKLVMVFCATRRNVDFVAENLNNRGIKAKAIHGGMDQNKRKKVLDEFNGIGGVSVLVCTDIAARGLDIEKVSHVYNYDLPKTSSDYIHRIGRTARAGKEGIAINILSSKDYNNFSSILTDEKLKITPVKLPYIKKVSIIINSDKRNNYRGNSRARDLSRGRSNARRYSQGSRGRDFGRNSGSKGNRNSKARSFGSSSARTYGRRKNNRPRNNFK